MELIIHWVTHHGYLGIFSLLMLGIVGIPIPDEAVLSFAGYLVHKGVLQIMPTIASAFLGSVCGITVSYGLGRTVGFYLIEKYGHVVHITAEKVSQVRNWFDRVGRWALLFGYFVPGIRHVTALVAGASKLQPSVFALFAYTGGFIWSATFISVGYFLGEEWARVFAAIQRHLVISSGLVVTLFVLYSLARRRKRRWR